MLQNLYVLFSINGAITEVQVTFAKGTDQTCSQVSEVQVQVKSQVSEVQVKSQVSEVKSKSSLKSLRSKSSLKSLRSSLSQVSSL